MVVLRKYSLYILEQRLIWMSTKFSQYHRWVWPHVSFVLMIFKFLWGNWRPCRFGPQVFIGLFASNGCLLIYTSVLVLQPRSRSIPSGPSPGCRVSCWPSLERPVLRRDRSSCKFIKSCPTNMRESHYLFVGSWICHFRQARSIRGER